MKVYVMAFGNAKSPEKRRSYNGKKVSIFSKKIRERRLELKLKQSELASILGIPQPRISELEGGAFIDDPERLIALCRALKTDPNHLFGFEKENA
jgi:transcriptional regulator with XRE-family HTH domain